MRPKYLISLLFFFSHFLINAQTQEIKNKYYKLEISKTGSLISFSNSTRSLLSKGSLENPLFMIRLRDNAGKTIEINSSVNNGLTFTNSDTNTVLKFNAIGGKNINAIATVSYSKSSPFTAWNLTIENNTELSIEYLDFPVIHVLGKLKGTGGENQIFRPTMEGVIIEDISIRESTWMKPVPVEFPNSGWMGYYPASCAMQFWAYYNQTNGLYVAAHDASFQYKAFEMFPQKNGSIELKTRLFPNGAGKGTYTMPYKMVIGAFEGDWYQAANIYRSWLEKSGMQKGPKIKDNKRLPEWFSQSPVIVTYPVRGTKDLGDMSTNEYYPYTKALPALDTISGKLDSKLLALLMHWEGSAPWAPPYGWPPYGGTDNFNKFTFDLHKRGHLIGLYASGTGYTTRSNTDTTYNKRQAFKEKNLAEVMTIAPDGSLAKNGICVGDWAQRDGYDMCPVHPFVTEVVKKEVKSILDNNVDYVQYFDQNIGGNCYMCYSKKHGHPVGAGKWQNDAMVSLYKKLQQMVDSSGKKMLIGCEGSAAEPFQPYLLFNDLRYNLNYLQGRPVPAYAYLYHEYISNFMGNQVAVEGGIDVNKSPLNYHQRVAHSFIAGDFLTLVLAEKGQLSWGWGSSWYSSKPDQQSLFKLVKNLNAWRKGKAKEYLLYGRMEEPFKLQGTYSIPIISPNGQKTEYPSLFTSAWKNTNGKRVQIIVNYTTKSQVASIIMDLSKGKKIKVYSSPSGNPMEFVVDAQGNLKLSIQPLDAIMLEY